MIVRDPSDNVSDRKFIMRFWNVSLIVLLGAIPLVAQSSPSAPGNPAPLFPNDVYAAQQQIQQQSDVSLVLNDLRTQMQQLTEEVRRLETEIAATRTQSSQAATTQARPAVKPSGSTPAVLVFRDGRRMEVSGYVIGDDKIWVIQNGNPVGFSLSDLNLEATRKENLKRGIDFTIPSE
jgi:hypothetical protein